MIYVAKWSQLIEPDKLTIELEGKTKRLLADLPIEDAEGVHHLLLIPEFQGAWMRVRITVENISPEET